ncbi:MAG: multiheme c-type cytochrome [Kofleriaceae bacterium]
MKYVVMLAMLAACSGGPDKTVAQLEDPSTCKVCHPKHFEQWASSMHAYASEDPVFVAMNKRGQRETNNQLGTFCVKCHAPMAVQLGLTKGYDYDPAALDATTKGITCYFCHNVDKVTDDHNNGLVLAMDQTMRGGTSDPADTPAHDSLDDTNLMASLTNQSTMCGSCHDIVTPTFNVHIERSFQEWKGTIFTQPGINGDTCSRCHMKVSSDPIAEGPGLAVKQRLDGFHLHTFPAIDQALTPFPGMDVQTAGIQDILDPAIAIVGPRPVAGGTPPGGICLDPPGTLSVRIDTFNVGHNFPSGASQDRRTWLEVVAYDASNNVVFSSGGVGDDQDPEELHDSHIDCTDPTNFACSGFWDRMTKSDGSEAHFFWDVANETSFFLKPPITLVSSDPAFDHSTTNKWDVSGVYGQIDHITARIRTRPFPYAALRDLVASGDLDPMFAQSLNTVEGMGAVKTWAKATKGTGDASLNTNCNFNGD